MSSVVGAHQGFGFFPVIGLVIVISLRSDATWLLLST